MRRLLPLILSATMCAHAAAAAELVDHHVHVFSAALRDRLKAELGIASLPPYGLAELIAALDKDHVTKAALLSTAYFFAKDTASRPADPRTFEAENDQVADIVARYPDRLVGFFSANPLADSALAEIERCARRHVFASIKLHLANSALDLRNPEHARKLMAVFRRASSLGLVIVIHMRTLRADYGREDAQIFVEQILPAAPYVPIQVAHLAGWGGYDTATDAALGVFVERAAKIDRAKDQVCFDVSAVIRGVPRDRARGSPGTSGNADWWPDDRYARLAERLRALGLDHVLFATDWPEWSAASYASDLEKNLPLTPDQLWTLFSNRAPWLR